MLGKEKNQPKAFKDSKLHMVINDEISTMIHGKEGNEAGEGVNPNLSSKQTMMMKYTDKKMKEMKKTEAEMEYYDKLS